MEPTTTNILLIILGSVSGVLIIVSIIIGIQISRLLRSLNKIASLFSDEADHMHKIIKKVRTKIHSMVS